MADHRTAVDQYILQNPMQAWWYACPKRNAGDAASSPMIKIKVSHGSYHHYITIPAQSTFVELGYCPPVTFPLMYRF
ncbi:hypothetical protein CK203_047424 [Vitis vinifera]|uniref:Uncharacterized protein n=1 Tax=Vitis vinifera TaxID=29760 RepID=A0A438G206_VITVI|nr:hypothetical protein CK203_047424 [Vitis vinifera]